MNLGVLRLVRSMYRQPRRDELGEFWTVGWPVSTRRRANARNPIQGGGGGG